MQSELNLERVKILVTVADCAIIDMTIIDIMTTEIFQKVPKLDFATSLYGLSLETLTILFRQHVRW